MMMMMILKNYKILGTVNQNNKNIDWYYITYTSFKKKTKLSIKYWREMYVVPNTILLFFVALIVLFLKSATAYSTV